MGKGHVTRKVHVTTDQDVGSDRVSCTRVYEGLDSRLDLIAINLPKLTENESSTGSHMHWNARCVTIAQAKVLNQAPLKSM